MKNETVAQLVAALEQRNVTDDALDRLCGSSDRLDAIAAMIISNDEHIIDFIVGNDKLRRRILQMCSTDFYTGRQDEYAISNPTFWIYKHSTTVVREVLRRLSSDRLVQLQLCCVEYLGPPRGVRLLRSDPFPPDLVMIVGTTMADVALSKEHAYLLSVEALVQSTGVSIPVDDSLKKSIGTQAVNALRREHITNLVELTEMRRKEVRNIPGIGKEAIARFTAALASHDLSFYDA